MIIHNMKIEGHELSALSFNPDASGHPIILLHGVTASVGLWIGEQVSLFTPYGAVYALSLPGHYPAAFPPSFQQKSLTAEMIARVLTTAIRNLIGEQTAVLVGHSTGGFAALAIAARAPELAHSVISIAGFAQGGWIGPLGLSQRILSHGFMGRLFFKAIYLSNRWPRYYFKTTWRIYSTNKERLFTFTSLDAIVDNMLPYYRKLDLEAMAQYFIAMAATNIEAWLPRITAPTLILVGDSDPIVPTAQSYIIADNIPNAQLELFKGAGHVLMFEMYDEYKQVVDKWLRKQVSSQ